MRQRLVAVVGGQAGEVVGDDAGVAVSGRPIFEQRKEFLVAQTSAQRVQGQRAALVDAVVEHVARPGIGQQQILRRSAQLLVILAGQVVGAGSAAVLRPQPLRVAGESLVQPDVAPLPHRDRVAEPLVGQLMGDRAARCRASRRSDWRRISKSLAPQAGISSIIVGHDDGVAVRQRIRAEQFDEQLHHLGLTSEVLVEVAPQPLGQRGVHRHRCRAQPRHLVHPDLQGDEIGRGRLGLFVGPDRSAPRARRRDASLPLATTR